MVRLDSLTGQTERSRRALIRGALVGLAGLAGVTTARTGGEEVASLVTDEHNDDEEVAIESADVSEDPRDDGDGSGDGSGGSRTKEVVSQVDLSERDGRVTVRLGAYERVVADLNPDDGDSVGNSAWRVGGRRAARSGVTFRAREGETVTVTLRNPTPIPYSFTFRSDDGDGDRLRADGQGVTVYGGDVETVVVDELEQGAYDYTVETLTRPIEPLVGRLLVDGE
ncbi:MAG: hypothetical protein R6V31_01620 [Halohasta sp.]